jgi:hypothetical protein
MTTLSHGRRDASLKPAYSLLCATLLAGCAHHAPAAIHGNTTVISGRNTAQASAADTRRTVLVEAASITVDHGYRYFEVMTPVRPGSDVTIRVYGQRENDPRTPNVYDAIAIAAGQLSKSTTP